MAISDAQFSEWLARDVERVVLCELKFAYESGGDVAEGTVYLSTGQYRTDATDAPASVNYHAAIAEAPSFERRIDVNTLGGRALLSVDSMAIDNDGSMDFMLDLIADGREARFYLGSPDWPRSDFRLAFVAVVHGVKADNDTRMTVDLRDKSYLLDDTIIGDTIASGPNAGKPRPILHGRIKNFDITPYLLDSAALTYYINNFALHSSTLLSYLEDVRDAGVSLRTNTLFSFSSANMTADAGTDTLTKVGHGLSVNDVVHFRKLLPGAGALFAGLSGDTQYWVIAAGLTADDFRLSLTKGGAAVDITGTVITNTWGCNRNRYYLDASAATLELSASPDGRVTIDMQALDAGNEVGVGAEPHAVFKYYLSHHTSLAASEYDDAALDDLAADESSIVSVGRAILDRTNVLDLLDEIATATYSWYGWTAAGVLTAGQLDLANIDAATATDTIAAGDVFGDPTCQQLPLEHGKVIINARRNVVTQTDGLAASVSAEDRSLWAQPFQARVSTTDPATATYLANWWDYHKTAIDSRPIDTIIDTGEQAACDAITALFRPWNRVIRVTVGLDKYALNPGDCVELTYPRYGFDAGKNCRVAGVKVNLTDETVELTLVTKMTPDYTTASYP